MDKEIKEMTLEEILRQQLELLAESSRQASTVDELVALTNAITNLIELSILS